MAYKNGKDYLPTELLEEIQKYLSGEIIYIPKKEETKVSWGELTGIREQVFQRNKNIKESYNNGTTIWQLMNDYCLSEASIRKIVCKKLVH